MIASSATDRQLAEGWVQGNRDSFAAIVDRYAPMILARCSRALPGADADDAVQAVFWVLFQNPEQAALSPRLAAWLLRVADNVCRNAHRDRLRRLRRQGTPLGTYPVGGPNGNSDSLGKQHLDDAIESLPHRERVVVRMHYLAGHTYAEIADTLGVAQSTIASRAKKGLERLGGFMRARGVSLSITGLIGLCAGASRTTQGQTSELVQIIRSWDPSAGGAETTATAPSAQAIRWSRRNSLPMKKITVMATLTLIILSALFLPGISAENDTKGTNTIRPENENRVSTNPNATDGNLSNDPYVSWGAASERERHLLAIHFPNPARTWQRFLQAPESQLIPKNIRSSIGDTMATMGELRLVLDTYSSMSQEKALEQQGLDNRLNTAFGAERIRIVKRADEEQQANQRPEYRPHLRASWHFNDTGDDKYLRTMEMAKSACVPLFMSGQVSLQFVGIEPRFSIALKSEDGRPREFTEVTIPEHVENERGWMTLREEAHAIHLAAGPGHNDIPWIKDDHPLLTSDSDPEADILLTSTIENPRTGHSFQTEGHNLTLVDGDLKITSRFDHVNESLKIRANQLHIMPIEILRKFPPDTIAAAAISLQNQALGDSDVLSTLILQMLSLGANNPAVDRMLNSVTNCLLQAEGPALIALREGPFLPLIHIELPTPRAEAQSLLNTLQETGFVNDSDGLLKLPMGAINLRVDWKGDRLVVTMDPGPIDLFQEMDQSFMDHPEVTDAIEQMPRQQGLHMLVVRRGALAKQLAPLAASANHEVAEQLEPWLQNLITNPKADWLLTSRGEHGWHVDANGLVTALVAMSGGSSILGSLAPMASN